MGLAQLERCWTIPLAGQFRWSVSDGGWSVSGRAARRILQRFQSAGQFGQFGQFWNHRSPRVAQFARAAARSTARSSAGGSYLDLPADRVAQITFFPTPMFHFLPKLTKLTRPGNPRLSGPSSWSVSSRWPVSSPGWSVSAASTLARRCSRSRRMPWIVRRTVLPRARSRDASSPCSASRFHSVRCLIGRLVPWSRASFCAAAKAASGSSSRSSSRIQPSRSPFGRQTSARRGRSRRRRAASPSRRHPRAAPRSSASAR